MQTPHASCRCRFSRADFNWDRSRAFDEAVLASMSEFLSPFFFLSRSFCLANLFLPFIIRSKQFLCITPFCIISLYYCHLSYLSGLSSTHFTRFPLHIRPFRSPCQPEPLPGSLIFLSYLSFLSHYEASFIHSALIVVRAFTRYSVRHPRHQIFSKHSTPPAEKPLKVGWLN